VSTVWEYGMVFNAVNYATPAIQEIVTGMQEIQTYSITVGQTTQQMGAMSYAGFRQLAFGAQMGLFYTTMLYGWMMRSESATISVERAQRNYNDAMQKYGASSEQAVSAMQSLEQAQLLQSRASMYNNVLMISMGIQMVSMAGTIYKYALPALSSLTESITAVGISFKAMLASIGPVGWAMLGIGTATAVGIGVYEATRPVVVNLPDTINVTTNTNDAIDQYASRLKRALNQRGTP
jgi:hypothetical protein